MNRYSRLAKWRVQVQEPREKFSVIFDHLVRFRYILPYLIPKAINAKGPDT